MNSSDLKVSQQTFEKLLHRNTQSILNKCFEVKAGHIGSSLSLSVILLPLLRYWQSVNRLNDVELVLSKGHASLGLYSLLSNLNINPEPFRRYCTLENDSYHGHTCKKSDNLIIHSTGSLGHGLPFAFGRALGNSVMGNLSNKMVVCIIGDGELQEGTFHEIYLHLYRMPGLNLKIIIDDNCSIETHTLSARRLVETLKLGCIHTLNCLSFKECLRIVDLTELPGVQLIHCLTSKYAGLPPKFHDPKWHAAVPSADELAEMKSNLTAIFTE